MSVNPFVQNRNGKNCLTCGNIVYPVDKITHNDYTLHKLCYKCFQCKTSIKPGCAFFDKVDKKIFCCERHLKSYQSASSVNSQRTIPRTVSMPVVTNFPLTHHQAFPTQRSESVNPSLPNQYSPQVPTETTTHILVSSEAVIEPQYPPTQETRESEQEASEERNPTIHDNSISPHRENPPDRVSTEAESPSQVSSEERNQIIHDSSISPQEPENLPDQVPIEAQSPSSELENPPDQVSTEAQSPAQETRESQNPSDQIPNEAQSPSQVQSPIQETKEVHSLPQPENLIDQISNNSDIETENQVPSDSPAPESREPENPPEPENPISELLKKSTPQETTQSSPNKPVELVFVTPISPRILPDPLRRTPSPIFRTPSPIFRTPVVPVSRLNPESNNEEILKLVNVLIRQGQCSKIEKALYKNQLVAVKIYLHSPDSLDISRIEKLIELSSGCQHVVPVLAVVKGEKFPLLVTQYINGEPLSDMLKCERISLRNQFEIALHIATGMSHLHKQGLKHGNLTPSSVLLEEIDGQNFIAKICGYEFPHDHNLNIGYCSPEFIMHEENSNSDIFAFGSVLWSLFARSEIFSEGKYALWSNERIANFIKKERRMKNPKSVIPSEVYSIILKCWHAKSSSRPQNFDVLLQDLKKAQNKVLAKEDSKDPLVLQDMDSFCLKWEKERKNLYECMSIKSAITNGALVEFLNSYWREMAIQFECTRFKTASFEDSNERKGPILIDILWTEAVSMSEFVQAIQSVRKIQKGPSKGSFRAFSVIKRNNAKAFWTLNFGTGGSAVIDWNGFVSVVLKDFEDRGDKDIRFKIRLFFEPLKQKIIGSGNSITPKDFNRLTEKGDWPDALVNVIHELEDRYHKIKPEVTELLNWLESLKLQGFPDYREHIIDLEVSYNYFRSLGRKELTDYLEKKVHMSQKDAKTVCKGLKNRSTSWEPDRPLTLDSNNESKWKINMNDLQFEKNISNGKSSVFSGKWRGCNVAIKQISSTSKRASTDLNIDAQHEAKVLIGLSGHSNVIHFFGAAYRSHMMYMLTEFCTEGNLRQLLSSPKELAWSLLLKIAVGISHGLSHIHKEGIIHGDIAARNILLTSDFTPRIGDFALAQFGDTRQPNLEKKVNILAVDSRWAAPEVLESRIMSTKSDTYSFGVLLWEISTRRIPYEHNSEEEINTLVINGQTNKFPEENLEPKEYRNIILMCWKKNRTERINSDILVKHLSTVEVPNGDPLVPQPSDEMRQKRLYGSNKSSGYIVLSDSEAVSSISSV